MEDTLRSLIENNEADMFYVGNNGEFDGCVLEVLKKLSAEFPNIKYCVVLAYMPNNKNKNEKDDFYYKNSIFPEEVAKSIPKFAIAKRNDWMLQKSDTVVTYVAHSFGCSHKYQEKAIKSGKTVINISCL